MIGRARQLPDLLGDRRAIAQPFWPSATLKRFGHERALESRFVERKAMINREHDLPITKQAQVLRISRGSVYDLTRAMRKPTRDR